MNRIFRVVLLCAVCGLGSSVPTAISYVPEIVSNTVLGRITQTTVALEQPLCVFNSSDTGCVICDVWLLVANASGVERFNSIKNENVDPSTLTFQDAFSGSNGFYLTVKTKRNVYSCPSTVVPGQILTLRVGAEVPCTTPNCNAPLPTGGTFRMKYVLINPDTTNAPNIVAETEFTAEIMLKSATDPNTIVPFSRRTGGMVVITTILSILLFLLLAMFVAMLAMVCCKKIHVV